MEGERGSRCWKCRKQIEDSGRLPRLCQDCNSCDTCHEKFRPNGKIDVNRKVHPSVVVHPGQYCDPRRDKSADLKCDACGDKLDQTKVKNLKRWPLLCPNCNSCDICFVDFREGDDVSIHNRGKQIIVRHEKKECDLDRPIRRSPFKCFECDRFLDRSKFKDPFRVPLWCMECFSCCQCGKALDDKEGYSFLKYKGYDILSCGAIKCDPYRMAKEIDKLEEQ